MIDLDVGDHTIRVDMLDAAGKVAVRASVPFTRPAGNQVSVVAQPGNAVWAALLLASFVCTCASFLGRAAMARERSEADDGRRGAKSFFYAAGLIEGTETILAFVAFCLLPAAFPWLAAAFASLCFWTAGGRLVATWQSESESGS